MVTPLSGIISMLGERRQSLLDQLDAVDKAIAALNGAGTIATDRAPVEPDVPALDAGTVVLPRRVTPRRVLSDAHKHALNTGRRKAREAKDAAAGRAREMPDESFVPAIGTRRDRQAPRLVTRPIK